MTLLLPLMIGLPLVGAVAATVLLGAVGLFAIATFAVTVVMGQACLPSRPGLASGVTLGLAIGLGGVAATALGVVADAYGLRAVLWTVAVLPIPAIALAVSLPFSLPAGGRRRVAPRAPDAPSHAR